MISPEQFREEDDAKGETPGLKKAREDGKRLEQMGEDNDYVISVREKMKTMSDASLEWLAKAVKEEREKRKGEK